MPFGPIQVQYPSGLFTSIISKMAGQGNILVYNSDANNTVYLTEKPSGNSAALEEASPLAPLSSIVVDGTKDIYGYTASPGLTAIVLRFPSASGFTPGSLNVTGNVNATVSGNVNIAGQSIPIDVSAATVTINPSLGYIPPGITQNIFTDNTTHTVSAGAALAYGIIDVSKYSSVDLTISANSNSQSTAGAAICGIVMMRWFDDVSGTNLVYEEEVGFWLSNAAGNQMPIRGSVPMHGHYMEILVFNPGSAATMNLTQVVVTGSYRTPVYSSWRQSTPLAAQITINGVTVTNMNYPAISGQAAYTGNLGTINNTTPGVGLRAYPIGFFSGPTWVFFSVTTATLVNVGTIVDMTFVTSGNLAAGTSQAGSIMNLPNSTTVNFSEVMMLPRGPCMLVVNPAATSTIQFAAVGQQGY